MAVLEGHKDTVTCLYYNNGFLFSSGLDCVIIKWDIKTYRSVLRFSGHTQWIRSLSFNEGTMISAGWEESLFLWETDTGRLKNKIPLDMGPISSVQTLGNLLLVLCKENGFQNQLTIIDFDV
jgi:WD40 repeat protein